MEDELVGMPDKAREERKAQRMKYEMINNRT